MRCLCTCRQVEEDVVKEVIRKGARYIEQIASECGAGAECGSCHMDLEDLIAKQEILEESYMKIQFKGKEFKITVLRNTMHPGFATYCFTDEEVAFRDKYWNVKKGDVVIDVGAAYGSYTLPACVMGAKVYAIEPEQKIIDNLIENVKINDFNCTISCIGFYDQDDVDVDIKTYAPHYATQQTSPSYLMMTLDTYCKWNKIEKLDWLKIDVEGCEEKVVDGGLATIEALRPNLIIECDDWIDKDIKTRIMNKLPNYNFERYERDDKISILVATPKGVGVSK